MSRPEIENDSTLSDYLDNCQALPITTTSTSIDLLEIPQSSETGFIWLEGLNHSALLTHLEKDEHTTQNIICPSLRVFFLSGHQDPIQNRYILDVHPSSLKWLQARFCISWIFIDWIVNLPIWSADGSLCVPQYDQAGNVIKLDAFYRIGGGIGGTTSIWFSYELAAESASATYLIFNCDWAVKNHILQCAKSQDIRLLRPLVIDAIIANGLSLAFRVNMNVSRKLLLRYEHRRVSEDSTEGYQSIFENLHDLSQTWHILQEDMTDFEETMEFLLDICKNFNRAFTVQTLLLTTKESITFLLSRVHRWKRWVANYNARTNIRINLFFNLANQRDSHTNLDIASTSKKIAEETQKDSSSMITIAAVTMFFLPGTFVSAVFNTVFFSPKPDDSGHSRLTIAPFFWYFPVISIPLTALVFLIWVLWQRQRGSKKGFVPSLNGSFRS